MSLVKWTNVGMPSISSMFDEFFNESLRSNGGRLPTSTLPAANVRETEDAYILEIAAPGLDKKDFEVLVDDGDLVISGQTSRSEKDESDERGYTRKEFSFGAFRRVFHLPEEVAQEAVHAHHENGVLYIQLPKVEEARRKPARTVKIK